MSAHVTRALHVSGCSMDEPIVIDKSLVRKLLYQRVLPRDPRGFDWFAIDHFEYIPGVGFQGIDGGQPVGPVIQLVIVPEEFPFSERKFVTLQDDLLY